MKSPPAAGAGGAAGHLCRAILSACIALLAVPGPAGAQRYPFTHYTADTGLPQQQVFWIHQDRAGYLWFATDAGVARYDGEDFRTFTTNDGLPGNRVTAIAEDATGHVLFGTLDGLSLLDDGRFREIAAQGGGGRSVRALHADADGRVWVATDDGLYSIRIDVDGGVTDRRDFPDVHARAIFRDSRRRLWVGGRDGLRRLDPGGADAAAAGVPPATHVLAITEDHAGTLWLGTNNGLFRGNGERFTAVVDAALANPCAKHVYAATVDPAGALWFGAWECVIRVDGGRIDLIVESHGLPNRNVLSAFSDREGNVWFGTDDGVAKLVPGPFTSYTESNGLPGDAVLDVAEDDDGRVWLATRRGLAVVEPDGRTWMAGAAHGFRAVTPTAVTRVPGGGVLVGTNRGLFRWDESVVEMLTVWEGLPSNAVTTLLTARDGDVWIGLDRGLARWSDGSVERVAGAMGLGDSPVVSLTEDGAGRIWIAVEPRGVHVYDPVEGRLEPIGRGLDDLSVWTTAADAAGRVWLGTNGRGAYRVGGSPDPLHLSTDDGLANDFVRQVVVDADERVWLYTNRGLDRLEPDDTVTHFDRGDGLIALEGNADAALRDSRGALWFGTARGAIRYVSDRDRVVPVPPLVAIQEAVAGGEPLPADGSASVPSTNGPFSFSFAGLTFRDETDTAFRYRLAGLDDAWSEPTRQGRVSYATLSPGDYRLEVLARNAQGLWSESPARFSFTVLPAFHETIWFRIALAALAVAAVVQAYWLRHRYVERERRKLARLVESRTQELLAETREKERFERQINFMTHHDPLTGLANRRLFERQFERASRQVRGRERVAAVLYLDLDRFHHINKARGYRTGDDVLRLMSERLSECVRPPDDDAPWGEDFGVTVARMEGDEFAALLVGLQDAAAASDVARRILGALARPIPLEDDEIVVTGSIGISLLSEGGSGLGRQLRQAHSAMLAAKTSGGNTSDFYAARMGASSAERLSIEAHLHRAIENRELRLAYQPIVDLETGRIETVEALLRWDSPKLGRVAPGVFIPIAEEAGIITALTEWVLRRACGDCRDWLSSLEEIPGVAVNLPAYQFRETDLVEGILKVLADVGLNPMHLEFELTESALFEASAAVTNTLDKLQSLGIGLAIDDFGTGYSSLSYLNRFALDKLKIDQVFVQDLVDESRNRDIVSAIIAMAHGLGLRVVAEGVETQEQLDFLRQQGCDCVQGYLISEPVPAAAIRDLLGRRHAPGMPLSQPDPVAPGIHLVR